MGVKDLLLFVIISVSFYFITKVVKFSKDGLQRGRHKFYKGAILSRLLILVMIKEPLEKVLVPEPIVLFLYDQETTLHEVNEFLFCIYLAADGHVRDHELKHLFVYQI